MNIKRKALHFFICSVLIAGCSADVSKKVFEIRGYNCEALTGIELKEELKEISGLAYDKQQNSFVAINDEQGIIFVLDMNTFDIKNKFHFGEKGDYEEIKLLEGIIYVLRSDGTIFKMTYTGSDISNITTFDYQGPKAEFESFYINQKNNQLVLIPKNSKESKANQSTTGYAIDASTGKFISNGDFKIDWKELSQSAYFHPSAVAIHPKTKEIYVLASIEKALIVLDTSHKLIAEYKLPSKTFQQPEGITFDEQGNLYISNEAGDANPTIVKIPIQTK